MDAAAKKRISHDSRSAYPSHYDHNAASLNKTYQKLSAYDNSSKTPNYSSYGQYKAGDALLPGSTYHSKSFIMRFFFWFQQYIMFGYFTPYMQRAAEGKAVRPEELCSFLKERDNLEYWSRTFSTAATYETQKSSDDHSRYTLLRVIWRVYWKHIIAIFGIKLLQVGLDVLSSQFFKGFLEWQERRPETVTPALRNRGILQGFAVAAMSLFLIFLFPQCQFWIDRIAMRIQGSLGTYLFQRTLATAGPKTLAKMEASEKKTKKSLLSNASTYNLLMLDIPSISRAMLSIIELIILPMRVVWSLWSLGGDMGRAMHYGLAVVLGCMFIAILLEVYVGILKKPLLHWRDLRLRHFHDIMTNIRGLRITGWQTIVSQDLIEARKKEISVRRKRMLINSVAWAASDSTRYLIQLTLFGCYVIWGMRDQPRDFVFRASVVMPTLQLILRLVGPLSQCSFLVHAVFEAGISCLRYQKRVFGLRTVQQLGDDKNKAVEDELFLEDTPLLFTSLNRADIPAAHPRKTTGEQCIVVKDAVFSWSPKLQNSEPATQDVFRVSVSDLEVSRGQCVILLGHPGSGKTSVIMALLGEMERHQGTCIVKRTPRTTLDKTDPAVSCSIDVTPTTKTAQCNGALGYASQTHWLPNDTVRSIILFSRPFNAQRYNSVITACELAPDIASWPNRDLRMVTQNGANLSGGQRTRVSLARALYDYPLPLDAPNNSIKRTKYNGCETFLLDDVFSSLDPTVGSQLFNHLIGKSGCLRHAASVITMDEQNLNFFFTSFQRLETQPSVDIFVKIVDNGVVSDFRVPLAVFLQSSAFSNPRPLSPKPQQEASLESTQLAAVKEKLSAISRNYGDCTALDETRSDTSTLSSENAPRLPKSPQPEESSTSAPEVKEKTAQGGIGWPCYVWYSKNGGVVFFTVLIVLAIIHSALRTSSDLWLAHWVGMNELPDSPETTSTPQSFFQQHVAYTPFSSSHASMAHLWLRIPSQSFGASAFDFFKNDRRFLGQTVTEHYVNYVLQRRFPLTSPSRDIPLNSTVVNRAHFLEKKINRNRYPRYNKQSSFLQQAVVSDPDLVGVITESPPLYKKPFLMTWKLEPYASLKVFSIICCFIVVGFFFMATMVTWASLRASVNIHKNLLQSVLNAPFWFYDALPIGMVISRFSADMQAVDSSPLYGIWRLLVALVNVTLAIIVICLIRPAWTPLAPVLGCLVYIFVYKMYRRTCREYQRAKLLAWSPLCGLFSEAETGGVIIRAFAVEKHYHSVNLQQTTNLLKTEFMQIGAMQWANTRLQLLAFPFTVFSSIVPVLVALLGVVSAGSWGSFLSCYLPESFFAPTVGFLGLAATYAMMLPSAASEIVLCTASLDKSMCSVQRLKELLESIQNSATTQHNKSQTDSSAIIQNLSDMPTQRTGLVLSHVEVAYRRVVNDASTSASGSVQYAPTYYPPSLIDISIKIQPGDHVGIVGRTGAGKSTLLLTLLDLVPLLKGSVTIDDVSLSQIHPDLRHKVVGVLPQVPLVMRGWTVRQFLDPAEVFDTATLMKAIKNVGMTKAVTALPDGLDTVIRRDETGQRHKSLKDPKALNSTNAAAATDTTATEKSTATQWLTDSQLRVLWIARLAMTAHEYRYVLMDEPPVKQVYHDRSILANQNANGEKSIETDLLKDLFPNTTLIIAAHYAKTIRHCKFVMVMSHGRLANVIPGERVTSQEVLMQLIRDAEQKR